ncbi:conserved hypothetical protein [Ricinus communis]|uniref:Uncharacterized protein n=1 Tax=Ricinus communis TaxID=3988 RepID=B9SR40_RICCO|nr:conserved hypothetical protein [Ricinus communis]
MLQVEIQAYEGPGFLNVPSDISTDDEEFSEDYEPDPDRVKTMTDIATQPEKGSVENEMQEEEKAKVQPQLQIRNEVENEMQEMDERIEMIFKIDQDNMELQVWKPAHGSQPSATNPLATDHFSK